MKIRLEKELLLIVTPESYVEKIALQAWSEKNDVSGGGLLIEAYTEQSVQADVCPQCGAEFSIETDPHNNISKCVACGTRQYGYCGCTFWGLDSLGHICKRCGGEVTQPSVQAE